jgi:hypothetical protein
LIQHRSLVAVARLTLVGVVVCVLLAVWSLRAIAAPPFPWRDRSGVAAPYAPRMYVAPAPRSRPVPVTPDSGSPAPSQPSLVPSIEPTPVEQPSSSPVRTQTFYSPRSADAHYPAGYGIHVGVTQAFLDELIKVESRDAGPVRDCILGAQVVGSQSTETTVHVRLVPNDQQAELEFQLSGVTRNMTENRTPQATIQSEGLHRFEVSKSVTFDGKKLLTRSPSATMYPYQRNRAATTPASSIPLLGPLVSQYALQMANQRRPMAERITAQKITEKVVPQFNNSVDERLTELNSQLRDVLPKHLPLLGISEPTTRVWTTDQQMKVSFAWDTVRSCPEYVPNAVAPGTSELRVALHSEAVKVWLESLPLGGLEIPVDDLDRWQKELQRSLSLRIWGDTRFGESPDKSPGQIVRAGRIPVRMVSDELKTPPRFGEPTIVGPLLVPRPGTGSSLKVPVIQTPPAEPTIDRPLNTPVPERKTDKVPTNDDVPNESPEFSGSDSLAQSTTQMILAKDNPLSVDFESGEAVITLTAAFRIAPAPQTGYHRIRIPLTSQMQGDELVVTPGLAKVETVGTAGPLSELMRMTIEKQVQMRLQPTSWPVERELKREKANPVVIRLNELSSNSGWLTFIWGVKQTIEPNVSNVSTARVW